MPRNVGSVEVTVDADTGKLKAQITQGAREAGISGARALSDELGDVNTREALDKVKLLAKQIERELKEIDDLELGVDAGELKAELERLKAVIASEEWDIAVDADLSKIKESLGAYRENQELNDLAITLQPDFTEINRLVKAWRQHEEFDDIQIPITPELQEALDKLRKVRYDQELDDIEVRLDLEIANAQEQLDTFQAQHPGLDVTLNADIAKAQAVVDAFTLQKAELNVRMAIKAAKAEAQAEAFRLAEEAKEIEWKASLTKSVFDAAAEAEGFRLAEEREEIEWKGSLTKALTEAGAEAVAFRLQQEEDDIDFQVEMHTALALAEGIALRDEISALEAKMKLDLDTAEANLQLFAFKRMTLEDTISIAVDTDMQWRSLFADKAALDALFHDIHPEIEPRFDPFSAAWSGTMAQVDTAATEAGNSAGKKMASGTGSGFSSSLGDSLQDGGKIMVAIVAGFGADLAPLVNAAIGSITEIASSAAFAVAGAAAFGLVAIAGLGAAAGATVVGLSGFGGAIKAINDEFKTARETQDASKLETALGNLAPNATTAALAFRDARGALGEARTEIQQELFSGFGTVIDTFATTTLPKLTDAAVIAAGDVNTLVTSLSEIAEHTDWVGLMQAVDPTVDNVFSVANDIMATLEPLLLSAAPAAEELSGYLATVVSDFRSWVQENPAKLTTFFDHGAQSLILWLQLIGSVGSLMGTIFGAGRGPGDTFVAKLDETITKWDEWLNTDVGQTALDDFFTGANQTLLDLDPVIQGLKDFITAIQTDDGGAQFSETMQALGDALPAIAEGLQLMSGLSIGRLLLRTVDLFGMLAEEVNKLPDPLLELAGAAYLAFKAFGPMEKAIKGVTGAIGLLQKASTGSVVIAALTAALAAGLFAWDMYKGKQEEVERRTNQLSEALRDSGDALLDSSDGVNTATLGLESFNEALLAGDEGAKLLGSLDNLGIKASRTRETLMNMATDPMGQLTQMAGSLGLTGDKAKLLATIVNETDDNFGNLNRDLSVAQMAHQDIREQMQGLGVDVEQNILSIDELSQATGVNKDSLETWLISAEHVQDQVDENNAVLEQMAQSELQAAAAGDVQHRSALAQAAAALDAADGGDRHTKSLTELAGIMEGSVPLYDEYMRKLAEQQAAQKAAEEGNLSGLSAQEQINQQIELGIIALHEKEEAERSARHEAFVAWKEETRGAREAADAIAEVAAIDFGDWGVTEDVARGFGELGDEINDAADAAQSFQDVYDKLFGGLGNWQEAVSQMEQGYDDLEQAMKGVKTEATEDSPAEMVEGWDVRLAPKVAGQAWRDFNTSVEAGQVGLEKTLGFIDDIINAGAVGIETRQDPDVVLAKMNAMRDSLEEQLVVFGMLPEEADAYVDALMGTPESMETVFRTPGLIDALLNTADLTVLYDDAGHPIVTEFEALGLDPALATSEAFVALLEELTGEDYTVVTNAEIAEADAEVTTFAEKMSDLSNPDRWHTWVHVETADADAAIAETDQGLTDVGNQAPAPEIQTYGMSQADESIERIMTHFNGLADAEAEPEVRIPSGETAAAIIGGVSDDVTNLGDQKAEPTIDVLASQIITLVLLAAIYTELKTINDFTAKPGLELPDYANVTTQLFTLSLKLALLSAYTAHPHVKLDNYDTVKSNIDTLQTEMNGLSGMVASPAVRLDNYDTIMQQIDNIQLNMANIHDRTVRINTVTSTTASNMTGGIIGSETITRVGERGYAEAIVPLQLPLNRVDPSVREMAALLRGESPAQRMGSGKVSRLPSPINQYFTLTSADPEAVAVQSLNRAAAMVS